MKHILFINKCFYKYNISHITYFIRSLKNISFEKIEMAMIFANKAIL